MKTKTSRNGNGPLLPELVMPGVRWDDSEYAALRMRLDLYDDSIVVRRFEAGQPGPLFAVDPLDLARTLADLPTSSGLLPPGCLFWGRVNGVERIAVYVEPQVWPVSVQGKAETWRVPLPGLVFMGQDQRYYVYAVKQRPVGLREQLFKAPVPNMDSGICRGNAPFPTASAGTIWQAVKAFFESGFNRHLSGEKSQQYPACIVDHWQALHEAGAEEYPLEDMVWSGITLGQLME